MCVFIIVPTSKFYQVIHLVNKLGPFAFFMCQLYFFSWTRTILQSCRRGWQSSSPRRHIKQRLLRRGYSGHVCLLPHANRLQARGTSLVAAAWPRRANTASTSAFPRPATSCNKAALLLSLMCPRNILKVVRFSDPSSRLAKAAGNAPTTREAVILIALFITDILPKLWRSGHPPYSSPSEKLCTQNFYVLFYHFLYVAETHVQANCLKFGKFGQIDVLTQDWNLGIVLVDFVCSGLSGF